MGSKAAPPMLTLTVRSAASDQAPTGSDMAEVM